MAVTLSDDELARYARHIVLKEIGGDGQRRLKEATAIIVGAGGIGSPAIQYLAAAGVGRLVIIDDDRVDASNLQRQTIFATDDVGAAKADAAARAAARINPHVTVEARAARIDAASVQRLIDAADVVLDGCDNFATRLLVADRVRQLRLPLVSAAVGQFDGQLAVYRGWQPAQPCYRCLVGNDPDRAETSCAESGVLGPVTGVIGSLAALEVIRAIVPFGEDVGGKLLLADLAAMRFRSVKVCKDPACICSSSTN